MKWAASALAQGTSILFLPELRFNVEKDWSVVISWLAFIIVRSGFLNSDERTRFNAYEI